MRVKITRIAPPKSKVVKISPVNVTTNDNELPSNSGEADKKVSRKKSSKASRKKVSRKKK